MPAGPNVTVWLDTTGRIHEKLHAKEPTLIWVRPDQYIGYRSQPAERQSPHGVYAALSRSVIQSKMTPVPFPHVT